MNGELVKKLEVVFMYFKQLSGIWLETGQQILPWYKVTWPRFKLGIYWIQI
jgi:hypothetical protein